MKYGGYTRVRGTTTLNEVVEALQHVRDDLDSRYVYLKLYRDGSGGVYSNDTEVYLWDELDSTNNEWPPRE